MYIGLYNVCKYIFKSFPTSEENRPQLNIHFLFVKSSVNALDDAKKIFALQN